MDVSAVRHAYRRWAPVYDFTFGQIAEAGRILSEVILYDPGALDTKKDGDDAGSVEQT